MLLEAEGKIKHLVSKEDIKKAILTPPETRAKSRGKFIKACFKNPGLAKRVREFNWGSAAIYDKIIYFGEINNPFSVSTVVENGWPFLRPGIDYRPLRHF
ncbi:MAG: proteasome accessory factor PafA2 family protein [Candidatus Harrisonbacteria bacterium]|nr:proteasome accessory factor PafA2 family protein [Candidatus Harrisonbacteria bacterium]